MPASPYVKRIEASRAIILPIADNLIKCNAHFSSLAGFWKSQGRNPHDSRVKVVCRILYQIVASGRVFAHPSQRGREYILMKVITFHGHHQTFFEVILSDLRNAIDQLSKAAYAAEAEAKKYQPVDDLRLKQRMTRNLDDC